MFLCHIFHLLTPNYLYFNVDSLYSMADSVREVQNLESLTTDAIDAASCLNWKKAAQLNEKILALSKSDVEAINRLARAQVCLGRRLQAEKLYKKALEIDPFNIIAKKNLEKIVKSDRSSAPSAGSTLNGHNQNLNLGSLFLFEPGKTKLVNLLNLAPPSILATLNCGDEVKIYPKNHAVTICDLHNVYLGALPDDLAHRLITLIAGGNKFDAYVKNATPKILSIFIREIFRSPRFASQPSFQHKLTYMDESEAAYY